jgi:hypothetical protein
LVDKHFYRVRDLKSRHVDLHERGLFGSQFVSFLPTRTCNRTNSTVTDVSSSYQQHVQHVQRQIILILFGELGVVIFW